MMKLQELLYNVNILKIVGRTDIEIYDIQFDSRKVQKQGLFIAIKGEVDDGHKFIECAIRKGVSVVIVENIPSKLKRDITYVKVDSSYNTLAIVAGNFYNNPSRKIKLIGVTGTNGKTTIVSLLHKLFMLINYKAGMLSTIENKILDQIITSTHTTPDPLQINYLLNKMIEKGCEFCFMEVSSHALAQGRVNGLSFSGGVFTNLTQDHLDYHQTFKEYRDVKKSFFDSLKKDAFAIVNKDDRNGKKMVESTDAKKLFYSLKSLADYRCKVLETQFEGMLLEIKKIDFWVRLIGDFNAYNILAVYAVAKQLVGFEDAKLLKGLSMLESPEGRFQFIRNEVAVTGIVDYAHTDDALRNILRVINNIRSNSEALITVVGCGGNRDKAKRPLMGQVACDFSTHVIITSDNPRTENPQEIINDMISALNPLQKKKVLIIKNRKEAIMTAGRLAKANDIILLAGKGHEKYQEIKSQKYPFDDMKELKKSLNII